MNEKHTGQAVSSCNASEMENKNTHDINGKEIFSKKIEQKILFYKKILLALNTCKAILKPNLATQLGITIKIALPPDAPLPILVLPKNNYWFDKVPIRHKALLEKIMMQAAEKLCQDVQIKKYDQWPILIDELETSAKNIKLSLFHMVPTLGEKKYNEMASSIFSLPSEYFCYVKLAEVNSENKNCQLTAKVHISNVDSKNNLYKLTANISKPNNSRETLKAENKSLHERISKLEQYIAKLRKNHQ